MARSNEVESSRPSSEDSQTLASPRFTAFDGDRQIASGSLADVAVAVKAAVRDGQAPILIFDDATGRAIDIDTRGSDSEVRERYHDGDTNVVSSSQPRPRGRPKLGVVAREITLLPRHWEWLSDQPGGASVALRKLVDDARRTQAGSGNRRTRQAATYQFMSAIAGNLPGFEEAARALFADDRTRVEQLIADWPSDIRRHALLLAFDTSTPESGTD